MRQLFVIVIICLSGCALFKRTNKTEYTNEREASKQIYLDRVGIKSANKESHTFSWWNDSSFYQYQNIREDVKEAQLERLNSKEKVSAKIKNVKKERASVNLWIPVGIVCLILGLVLLYRRLF